MSPPQSSPSSSSSSSQLTLAGNDAESTPLLSKNQDGDALDVGGDKPLPTMQILLLCIGRLLEPIAFFAIFPFIAQMVQRNGDLPDSDVGFYSGLIESMFSIVQVFVLIFWGRLADRIGRKPVILVTLTGMAVGTMAYTMATTIPLMILFRCVAGLFSGSSLVIRTMISDHCTPQTQATAFSWFAFANNIGIFVGPILGGALADPVAQYPGMFGRSAFLQRYPYALVGLVLTALSIAGILVSAIYLEETLDLNDGHQTTNKGRDDGRPDRPSIPELLKAPGVAVVIWVYCHFMLLAFSFTAILPVVLFTPVAIGGVGFSSFDISIYMAIMGASQALWLLLVFPPAQRRWGTKVVLRLCGTVYPLFLGTFPLANALLRLGSDSAVASAWAIGFFGVVIGPGVSIAFTGVQLAVNDVAPNPHVLGTLNAVAMTAASAIRAFVPGVATAVFAVGVRGQIVWGHLAWAVLIPISMAVNVFIKYMPDDKLSRRRDDKIVEDLE